MTGFSKGRLIKGGLDCPSCGHHRCFAKYTNGTYCFSCKEVLNTTRRDYLPKDHLLEISNTTYITDKNQEQEIFNGLKEKYGFIDDEIKENEFQWLNEFTVNNQTYYNRLMIPVQDSAEYKSLFGVHPKNISFGPKKLWFSKVNNQEYFGAFIITEDIFSAIKCRRVCPSIALRGTTLSVDQYNQLMQWLHAKMFTTVYIWLDNDEAGQKASIKIHDRLKFLFNPNDIFIIKSLQDPKYYDESEIKGFLDKANGNIE